MNFKVTHVSRVDIRFKSEGKHVRVLWEALLASAPNEPSYVIYLNSLNNWELPPNVALTETEKQDVLAQFEKIFRIAARLLSSNKRRPQRSISTPSVARRRHGKKISTSAQPGSPSRHDRARQVVALFACALSCPDRSTAPPCSAYRPSLATGRPWRRPAPGPVRRGRRRRPGGAWRAGRPPSPLSGSTRGP